jgi:hypothetical protein
MAFLLNIVLCFSPAGEPTVRMVMNKAGCRQRLEKGCVHSDYVEISLDEVNGSLQRTMLAYRDELLRNSRVKHSRIIRWTDDLVSGHGSLYRDIPQRSPGPERKEG